MNLVTPILRKSCRKRNMALGSEIVDFLGALVFSVGGVRRLVGVLGAALLFGALGCSAEAALVYTPGHTDDGGSYLVVSGEFEASDDVSKFLAAVQADGTKVIFFNSPGGNVAKAMEIGRLIRSLRLATIQIRSVECASACSLAFMGGQPRFADPGSIGVHKTSFADTTGMNVADAVSAIQQVTSEVIAYMMEMGIDPGLLQLALNYDSNDMRYLSSSEMARYRLATDGTTPTQEASVMPAIPYAPPASTPTALPQPTVASLPPPTTQYPELSIPAAHSGRIQHYKGIAPLKAAPTMSSPTEENFANGSSVAILQDTGKWYQVRVGNRVGYMFHAWVWVDQFGASTFGKQFIQVKSFDNLAATEQYVRSSPLHLVAYLATNGWFAITLDRTFDPGDAKQITERLRGSGSIPDDAIATFGNAFVRRVCCG
jgi:hypothetical protein